MVCHTAIISATSAVFRGGTMRIVSDVPSKLQSAEPEVRSSTQILFGLPAQTASVLATGAVPTPDLSVPSCKEPLADVRKDFWCLTTHAHLQFKCHVPVCARKVDPTTGEKWRTCDIPAHWIQEVNRRAKGAVTRLREALRRPGAATADGDAALLEIFAGVRASLLEDSDNVPIHGLRDEEYAEVSRFPQVWLYLKVPYSVQISNCQLADMLESINEAEEQPQVGGGTHAEATEAKLTAPERAKLSKSRTFAIQTFVAGCGIIINIHELFKSEGIHEVLLPPQLEDDTASARSLDKAARQASAEDIKNWERWCVLKHILNLVDRFHKKNKHKVDDDWCNRHCDVELVPWMRDSNGKSTTLPHIRTLMCPSLYLGNNLYNTSVIELVNVWLARGFNILHGMEPTMFRFFLDEMIYIRNEWEIEKLRADGYNPTEIQNEP
ncbi:hypothetical protein P7C70_g8738, partial [Phenoliferia sp. Uapishka_3]